MEVLAMSKESKATPSEYWIYHNLSHQGCSDVYDSPIFLESDAKGIEPIHVVEYSALLEERAKSARLLEVLKCYADEKLIVTVDEEIGDGPMAGWVQCDNGDWARKAITDYNQSEGGG